MAIHFPTIKMVRYADDMIVHCDTEEQAKGIANQKLIVVFKECGLKGIKFNSWGARHKS